MNCTESFYIISTLSLIGISISSFKLTTWSITYIFFRIGRLSFCLLGLLHIFDGKCHEHFQILRELSFFNFYFISDSTTPASVIVFFTYTEHVILSQASSSKCGSRSRHSPDMVKQHMAAVAASRAMQQSEKQPTCDCTAKSHFCSCSDATAVIYVENRQPKLMIKERLSDNRNSDVMLQQLWNSFHMFSQYTHVQKKSNTIGYTIWAAALVLLPLPKSCTPQSVNGHWKYWICM